MARGLNSNNIYAESDILNNLLYPRMKNEPLIDDDDCIVIPVRNREKPHFRRIGTPSFTNRLGRTENNPTHNDCVDEFKKQLSTSSNFSIQFFTYVFPKDKDRDEREEEILFFSPKDSDYRWFKEADARVGFHDGVYIQPDIAGTERDRFFPRSAYPNIIIEVIRTHYPEMETLERLIELSKTNHHVFFYFIAEGEKHSRLNSFNNKDGCLKIRFSYYLIGGNLYKNGEIFSEKREYQSFENWYNYLKNSYFKYAMEKA